MIKKIIFLIIVVFSSGIYSQEIFIGEFENTPATFKSIQERVGNRTFVQLQLKEDNTFVFESYVYNKFDDLNKKFNCTILTGNWFKENEIVTFIPKGKDKKFKYKYSSDNKLTQIGYGKKYARKTRLTRVNKIKSIKCDTSVKSLEPDW